MCVLLSSPNRAKFIAKARVEGTERGQRGEESPRAITPIWYAATLKTRTSHLTVEYGTVSPGSGASSMHM